MGKAIVLFRSDGTPEIEHEKEVASQFFTVISSRAQILTFSHPSKPTLIVPRYSALPYYRELEIDAKCLGGNLIDSYEQYQWIANFDWYGPLSQYTFPSWHEYSFAVVDPSQAPFVVKGKTNSRKHQWNKLMYAAIKERAVEIACDLHNDPMIGEQGIIYRKYIPLKTYEIGINGLPFTNEWRLFFLGNKLLSYGYYWINVADKPELAKLTQEGIELAKKCAEICAQYTNFFVLDVAEKADGGWILVECNHGTMSGLSDNNPNELYSNLKTALMELSYDSRKY